MNKKLRAAEQIKEFRGMFSALFELGDEIEKVGFMEAEAEKIEVRIASARNKERLLQGTEELEKQIADAELRLAGLKKEEARLLAAREAVDKAKEELRRLEESIKEIRKEKEAWKRTVERAAGISGASAK
jgi:DNA repair exonuclease SbcCD ATPase subunit